MMVVLMKDGRTEECLEYWRQLVCVNGLNSVVIHPETYNFAIKCTATVGNLGEMEAVLAMMEVRVCLWVSVSVPVSVFASAIMVTDTMRTHDLFRYVWRFTLYTEAIWHI